ncbi:hypothetical protein GCM10010220_01960 [Streptomyces parvulus]|nr:hypothetical protein GCM10010220_01960 [Streptomyces parvulus]
MTAAAVTAARQAGTTEATPAVAVRPAEAGRPAGEEGAAADAVEAADTGQLSSGQGEPHPRRGGRSWDRAPGPAQSAHRVAHPVGARTLRRTPFARGVRPG